MEPTKCGNPSWPFCRINKTPLGDAIQRRGTIYVKTCPVCGKEYVFDTSPTRATPGDIQKILDRMVWTI